MKKIIIILLTLACIHQTQGQDSDQVDSDFLIKKGRFFTSSTFFLNQREAENEDQLFRQVINQDRYNYRIISNSGYAIKNNMTLGLSLAYGRLKEEITFLDENDQEVTSKRLEQGFSFTPTMRNYIPIGSGQLQIVVQTELGSL